MDYEKELLKFQYSLGVDNIFDFITGRDFKKKIKNPSQQNGIQSNDIELSMNKQAILDNNNFDDVKQDLQYNYQSNNHIENAITNLNKISNIDDVVKEIKNYYGCKLKLHAKNDVIFDGKIDAKIMLIGEAPGENEDNEGIPFCGQSGKLLRKAIRYINLSTDENLFITNIVYWRPPMNRKPDESEISQCLPFVYKIIDIIQPKMIILCGATAISTILQTNSKVSDVVGKFNDTPKPLLDKLNVNIANIPTFSLYHPSYLMRNPSMKKVFWQHLLVLKKYLADNY